MAGEPDAWTGGDRQDGGGESSRPQTGGAPSRDYPAGPQVVHREGLREGAGYAGEASNPGPADPGAALRGRRPIAACCRDTTGMEDPCDSLTNLRELPLASPMGESGCPCRSALPAVGGGGLPPACGNGLSPPGGGPPPETGPTGKSGCGCWCAPLGLHRAGPREGARYGYRGVIVGEASHPGPVPSPANLSGAASPGEVLRYMRPTAGAGIGPSRGAIARERAGGPQGLADAVNPPWEPVRTCRSRPAPREGTPTWLGARLPDLGVPPLRTRAPILLWFTPLRAPLALPSPRWLRIGRMTSLVKPPVARLAMRGLPGPRTSHCLLLGLGSTRCPPRLSRLRS